MYKNGERMMSWIVNIDNVEKHPDADVLDICTVGGWKCITKRGEFQKDQKAVYISIDSWVPHTLAPFLSKGNEPREYNGVKGEKLRTLKLRGKISQGLLLPVSVVVQDGVNGEEFPFIEGSDVSEILGIQKWEQPIDGKLSGEIKSSFPSFIPKTDQERVQNLKNQLAIFQVNNLLFEITEKLDGSSCTIYYYNGEIGVCSRNLELKEDKDNVFWFVAKKQKLIDILSSLKRNIALQGEVIGPKIQGNLYGVNEPMFFLYDIFDIDKGEYLPMEERWNFSAENNIYHVPVLGKNEPIVGNMDDIISSAAGYSILNIKAQREGVVYKSVCDPSNIHFKAISNIFLLKQK